MNAWTDEVTTYNWWFNTYPLEFGEFLLVTALTRGVWLHPLSANDLGYQHIDIFADDIHEDKIGLFLLTIYTGVQEVSHTTPPHLPYLFWVYL